MKTSINIVKGAHPLKVQIALVKEAHPLKASIDNTKGGPIPKNNQHTAWTFNDVLVDPYPFIILVNPYSILFYCPKIIKGYGSIKMSLTNHTVFISAKGGPPLESIK